VNDPRDTFSGRATGLMRVVSVCEAKDIRVWKIASKRIVRHIRSESYQLFCPDLQIPLFQDASDPAWEIIGENAITSNCPVSKIRGMVSGENHGRVNWLFQQFVKINAISSSGLADSDAVLIWDADTVPLRNIGFVEGGNGRLLCYHGTEHHEPYFETIGKLLGPGKTAGVSFIAQCLPLRAGWLREMVREIEGLAGLPYAEAVLACLPGLSGAEFSEYETAGTWIIRNHPDGIFFRERNVWLRGGSSVFPSDLSSVFSAALFSILSLRYDFVAIETWKTEVSFGRVIRAAARRLRLSSVSDRA